MPAARPLILDAESWAGNDGNWSTWPMQVGSPPQDFNVLPATSHGEVWVPLVEGCDQQPFANISSCALSRGVGEFQGMQNSGYQLNASSTWVDVGIYALPVQDGLFDVDENGHYGNDTAIVQHGNGTAEIKGQNVVGIATQDFWLGSIGIAQRAANFSVESTIVHSLLDRLKNENATPSASFGLDVGASYKNAPGSLILGGYDASASSGHAITISDIAELDLAVNVRSIVMSNTPQDTQSATHDLLSLPMTLDSTVSQLWLPRVVCDEMEAALGLTYDDSTELYIVNETAHAKLTDYAPTFTFKLSANSTTDETTTITLPYAAFDLRVGPPIYNFATYYFPIRRARKGSILGRAFLQEAYLVVDWERGNFTISPAARGEDRTRNVVSIPPRHEASQSHALSTGGIVGVAISVTVVVIALIAFVLWKLHTRRKRKQKAVAEFPRPPSPYIEDKKIADAGFDPTEAVRSDSIHSEAMSMPVHELGQEQACQPSRFELAAETVGPELEAKPQESELRPDRSESEARTSGNGSSAVQ